MTHLPTALPRALVDAGFRDDPLGRLASARTRLGNALVLREEGPLLSRDPGCRGVVAVFGVAHHRAVLSDIEAFGMPPSAAEVLAMRGRVARLNRSLHGMRGDEHGRHKRVLMSLLDDPIVNGRANELDDLLDSHTGSWVPGTRVELLSTLRTITEGIASRLMFGRDEAPSLSRMIRDFFHLRREGSSPTATTDLEASQLLTAAGRAVDRALRARIRKERRAAGRSSPTDLLGRLASAGVQGAELSEDEIVGHANIFFVSIMEPMAIALVWTLLILSQVPALRTHLRREIRKSLDANADLLDGVILESLRLLPPNAFMVRVTTRHVAFDGIALPDRCEVVLCPFLSHRDPSAFPDPGSFRPDRWKTLRPSPFQYFPFGAGGHSCVGRGLALRIMKNVLTYLLERYDLVLASDQSVDWRVHIQFMPRSEIELIVRSTEASAMCPAGRIQGPVSELFSTASQVS